MITKRLEYCKSNILFRSFHQSARISRSWAHIPSKIVFYGKNHQNKWCPRYDYTDEHCAENLESRLPACKVKLLKCADKQQLQFQSKTHKGNFKNIVH